MTEWDWTKDQNGLGFHSHCWSCVDVPGKRFIPHCLCLPSSDGYLVDENRGSGCLYTCMTRALYSSRGNEIAQVMRAYTREGKGQLNMV